MLKSICFSFPVAFLYLRFFYLSRRGIILYPTRQHTMQHTQPWKRMRPTVRDASGGAEQPASRISEPASSVAQPARMLTHSTSTDVLSDMRRCIVWANAEDYNSWKISHPNAKEETTINVINHLQSSMRAAFHNSAERQWRS